MQYDVERGFLKICTACNKILEKAEGTDKIIMYTKCDICKEKEL
jgi:phage FluMu protein Com